MILCRRPWERRPENWFSARSCWDSLAVWASWRKFITVTIGVYIAGRLVRDPRNRKMVGIAAIGGVIIQQAHGNDCGYPEGAVCGNRISRRYRDSRKVYLRQKDLHASMTCCSPESCSACCPRLFLVPKTLRQDRAASWHAAQDSRKQLWEPISGKSRSSARWRHLRRRSERKCWRRAALSLIDWEADWAESDNGPGSRHGGSGSDRSCVRLLVQIKVRYQWIGHGENSVSKEGSRSIDVNSIEIRHLTLYLPGR